MQQHPEEQTRNSRFEDSSRLQSLLVGERYAGACLSQIREIDSGLSIGSLVSSYLKDPKGFLVYLGAPGVGKTYLCSAILPWIDRKVNSYYYVKEINYLISLRECIDKGWDYSRQIQEKYDHDFLIFDDFGSSGFNEWRSEVLFSLIDYRYEKGKPMMITSNLNREQIVKYMGELSGYRMTSRLFAKQNTVIENHSGEDLRQNGY